MGSREIIDLPSSNYLNYIKGYAEAIIQALKDDFAREILRYVKIKKLAEHINFNATSKNSSIGKHFENIWEAANQAETTIKTKKHSHERHDEIVASFEQIKRNAINAIADIKKVLKEKRKIESFATEIKSHAA